MKRIALYIGFAYTAGLLIASVVHWQLWFGVLLAVLMTAILIILYHKTAWKYVLISTLSLLMACCVYWCHNALVIDNQLELAGAEDTVFTGEIVEISLHDSGYATYILDGTLQGTIPAKVKFFCDYQGYAYGDALTLTGTPEQIESSYVFDAESYYCSENVFLTMPMDAQVVHESRSNATLRSVLYEWRMRMTQRILERTADESGAFMTGMLFGDKSAMTDSTKTSLYRTGIGHVLAVSGLHLDFLALFVIRMLRKRKADRRLSFGILAVLAILFVICVGETVSVKRACIMILISQSAGLFCRKADMLNSMSIAMLLLTLENPMVIHSAAFWLSFSGTFGIAVFAPYMTKNMKSETFLQKEWKAFAAAGCVFLALLPTSVLYFQEISLISPIANLLMVPPCMLILLLEALAVLLGAWGFAAEILLWISERISDFILQVSAYLAELPWTCFGTDSRVLLFCIAASGALIAVCYGCWKSQRFVGIAIAISLVTTSLAAGSERMYQNQNFHIAILGEERDCVLVLRKGREAIIVDVSGDSQAPDYVETYLQSTGVRNVEAVFLCDPKIKNVEGYEQILNFSQPEHVIFIQKPDDEIQYTLDGEAADRTQQREFLFHGAVIAVSEETIRVEYGGVTCFCSKENQPEIPECEILCIYGTSRDVLPDCGVLMVLDVRSCYTADENTFVGENNLELTITDSGKCRVRSLYADH